MTDQDRRILQAEGKHPAPCAKFCEATAFNIELRQARKALERRDALLGECYVALLPHKSTVLRWYTPVDASLDAIEKHFGGKP